MLKSLKYSVEFPTGKKLSADLVFQKGMTAISGRNEAGKSMVLEMIRYGLFGTPALRGKSADYKKLSMQMEFSVRGKSYFVTRSGSKAEIQIDGAPLATGTVPVNQCIRDLFGYDLKVFDTANNCAQGEIERLGTMKPTERKELVDQTVGLTALDGLINWLGDELSAERRAHEAMEGLLREPEKPAQPDDYAPVPDLEARYAELSKLTNEHNQLEGWMANAVGRKAPVNPGPAPSPMSAAELRDHENKRTEAERRLERIKSELNSIPETNVTAEALEVAKQAIQHNALVREREQLEARYPVPPVTAQDLEDIDRAHQAKDLIDEIARLEASDRIVCPACNSDFPHEHDQIDKLTKDLTALQPFDVTLTEQYSKRDLHRFMAMHEVRAKEQGKIDALPTTTVDELMTSQQIQFHAHALSRKEYRKGLEQELLNHQSYENKSAELMDMVAWERDMARFMAEQESWKSFVAERDEKAARLETLRAMNPEQARVAAASALHSAKMYDNSVEIYTKAYSAFVEHKLVADRRKERMEQLEKARKALRELKVRVKGYLLPSLNRVASALLSNMTGGERNTVHIDDDFEITVDGQALATLSGSGKAVANLAIRLGLGQVLTNKVFSVFMADEIDAAMDMNRAGYTAECLSRLTANIGQVILVSHKTINASHHIVVGNTPNEIERSSSSSEEDD